MERYHHTHTHTHHTGERLWTLCAQSAFQSLVSQESKEREVQLFTCIVFAGCLRDLGGHIEAWTESSGCG